MPLLAYLIVSVVSCAGLKPFPTSTLYEFDNKNQVCGEYKIVDPENFKFQYVRDYPLAKCPAIFGFNSTDVAPVLDWLKDSKDYIRNHCK